MHWPIDLDTAALTSTLALGAGMTALAAGPLPGRGLEPRPTSSP
jgi:hypothetical protein